MRDRGVDLALAVLSFVALAAIAALSEHVIAARPLRLLLGIVCTLALPGYCTAAALFPRRSDLDSWERAAMSIGLSLAAIPLVTVVVDRLPWRLSPLSVGLSLGLWTCAWAAIAWRRRGDVAAARGDVGLLETHDSWRLTRPSGTAPPLGDVADRTISSQSAALRATQAVPSATGIFLLGLGVGAAPRNRASSRSGIAGIVLPALGVGAAGALLAVAAFSLPWPASPTTELYVLGSGGLAGDYPRRAVVGQPLEVVIGIANQEGVAARYRIEALQSGRVIGRMGPVLLQPAAEGEWTVSLAPDAPGPNVTVTLALYRDGGATPYRTTRLWFEAATP